MKIRQGFVSNSSSSSFVILGFDIPKDMSIEDIFCKIFETTKEEIEKEVAFYETSYSMIDLEFVEEYNWKYLSCGKSGLPNDIFGKIISEKWDNDPDSSKKIQIPLNNIFNEMNDIKKQLDIDSEIKIYVLNSFR